jgi:hypothetical protein
MATETVSRVKETEGVQIAHVTRAAQHWLSQAILLWMCGNKTKLNGQCLKKQTMGTWMGYKVTCIKRSEFMRVKFKNGKFYKC